MFVVIALSLLLAGCVLAPPEFDEDAWRGRVLAQETEALYAPHKRDGVYFNPWMERVHAGFGRFLKWRFTRKADYTDEARKHLPEVIPDLERRIAEYGQGDFIVWIGHATFLLRIDGQYWLTDPMLSDRALLPKRVTPPAIDMEGLARLAPRANVIISHNHYDHLDEDTIEALPDTCRIFVPMGLKELVASWHGGKVTEMDWWQRLELPGGVRLTCLPAQHWSRRIGQGTNTTLWASYMVAAPSVTVYYAADSGYFIGYKEIGRHFPGIDYALIPTTAYHPRWFMHYPHMDTAEAITAFNDLNARHFIPTQWGTFHLGDNPSGLPALELADNIRRMGQDPQRFSIPAIGEILPLQPGKGESPDP